MKVLLTILGMLLLLTAVAGIIFGGFMALDPKTRYGGVLFALWWVSGFAAALGVLMRDPATFAMGLLCFAMAGLALVLEERLSPKKPAARRRPPSAASEKTTRENPVRERSEDAS